MNTNKLFVYQGHHLVNIDQEENFQFLLIDVIFFQLMVSSFLFSNSTQRSVHVAERISENVHVLED